jgi:predicted nucleic acid-binding Zn ribbon protein
LAAVQQALPPELQPQVWSATLGPHGVLTVVTDTGSWATRIRYAAPALAPAVAATLGAAVARVAVRVRPRPA